MIHSSNICGHRNFFYIRWPHLQCISILPQFVPLVRISRKQYKIHKICWHITERSFLKEYNGKNPIEIRQEIKKICMLTNITRWPYFTQKWCIIETFYKNTFLLVFHKDSNEKKNPSKSLEAEKLDFCQICHSCSL